MNKRLWISAWWPLWDWVIDSPSWLNTYMHFIILEWKKRWDEIFWLQKDIEKNNFVVKSFYEEERKEARNYLKYSDNEFPELDSIYIEWRFPIPWRNTEDAKWSEWYQTDLERQTEIIEHYIKDKNCKINILDQDYKMTIEDEQKLFDLVQKYRDWNVENFRILDNWTNPKTLIFERQHIWIPFDYEKIKSNWLSNLRTCYNENWVNWSHIDSSVVLTYIWNNYERNRVINSYLEEIKKDEDLKNKIHFYWNWQKYWKWKLDQLFKDFSNMDIINFHPRITKEMINWLYSLSLAVPLFLKDDYMEHWFLTQRFLETLNWWSIAIWIWETKWIERKIQKDLIVNSSLELKELLKKLMKQTWEERKEMFLKQFDLLNQNETELFYNKLFE